MENITFLYPVRIMPGMVSNALNTPDMVTYVSDFSQSISLYLYTGLVLEKNSNYYLEIDILSDGESILPKDEFVSDTEILTQHVNNSGDFINLSCSWIPGVKVKSEGPIEIKATLIKTDEFSENKVVLGTRSCLLLVRKQSSEVQ